MFVLQLIMERVYFYISSGRNCIFLSIAFAPTLIFAQDLRMESCAATLDDVHKKIFKGDSEKSLFGGMIEAPNRAKLMEARNEWSACVTGKMIPNLDITTISKRKYNKSNLAGNILVINFWFKGCVPCVAEMPSLNRLRNEFKDRSVIFIGFASDSEAALKPVYLNKDKFLFEIVANSIPIGQKFAVCGYPTTYIVNEKGIVVKAWIGYTHDPYEIAKPIINQLLSKMSR